MRHAEGNEDEEEVKESVARPPKKNLYEYEQIDGLNTEFFCYQNPDDMEKNLLLALENSGIEPTIKKDKYKIRFTQQYTNKLDQKSSIKICVKFLKVNDQKIVIEFNNNGGDKLEFIKTFKYY